MKDVDVIMLAFILADLSALFAFLTLNLKLNKIIKKLDRDQLR